MVNENVLVKDKWRIIKKISKILIILVLIIGILASVYFFGFFSKKDDSKTTIVLENPLKDIVFANTNEAGEVNKNVVIEQGILEFNEEYINYILVAMGINNLHKSLIGFGNPIVEFILDDEIWSSEIDNGNLITKKEINENKDLKIIISKQEAVEALLSSDIQSFMKDSVVSGNTKIEMIANKAELFSKGYLDMYKDLTGEEIELSKE